MCIRDRCDSMALTTAAPMLRHCVALISLNWITGPVKKTPLYQLHIEAGAKMAEFAGYEMPLFYPLGILKEHLQTRSQAGLFDISHMAQVEISGKGAAALLARLCPYDAIAQETGRPRYTFFLNQNAGIIDD